MAAYLEVWRAVGCDLVVLEETRRTIGREETNDIALMTDDTVSRVHAVLDAYGTAWSIRDMGSFNGTFVNGERLVGDRILRTGDEITIGATRLVFRGEGGSPRTAGATAGADKPPKLTPREHDLLVALCRPMRAGGTFTRPASINDMAQALVVSPAAVKFHLTNLYGKFGIEGNGRLVQLANEALRRRAITPADLA